MARGGRWVVRNALFVERGRGLVTLESLGWGVEGGRRRGEREGDELHASRTTGPVAEVEVEALALVDEGADAVLEDLVSD